MRKKILLEENDRLNRKAMRLEARERLLEYKLRNYEEKNGNPYTFIREIKNIIRKEK